MNCSQMQAKFKHHLVGDPVDVVTGASTDVTRDFSLPGPILFYWRRCYDSSHCHRQFALGWGHSHWYERSLRFDIDGLRYTGPVGQSVSFPPLEHDGDEATSEGLVLRRISLYRYHLDAPGEPTQEFEFNDVHRPAPLKTLLKGDHCISFGYGPAEQLETILDSRGRLIRVECDDEGRILQLLRTATAGQADRSLITYRYDSAGNLIEGTDYYGNSFGFEYDEDNRLVRRTDRRGYSFLYTYDRDGRCVHSRGEDGAYEVRIRYLPIEHVTIVTKADKGEWTYLYDENETVFQILDPYGGSTRFKMDDQGRVAEEVDPNGNVTRMVYDRAGGLIGKMTPLLDFVPLPEDPGAPGPKAHWVPNCPLEWEYGVILSREQITPPTWEDTVLREIPNWAQSSIQTVAPEQLDTQPPKESDNDRYTTDDGQVYNDVGLLLSERGASGGLRRFSYDASGNNVRYHDRDGSTYAYEYTSWNLRSREIDPLGNTICYRYTPTRKLAAVVDGKNNLSEYAYDHKDRLIQVRRHGVVKEEYVFDLADKLVEKRNGKGETLLSFEIGPGNLKKVRRLASGENHYFEYDERGHVVLAATDNLEVRFAYDGYGHRIQELRDGRGVQHRFEGNRLAETTVFEKFTTRYLHQPDGTLIIQDPGGGEHRVHLLARGLVVRHLSNGSSEVSQFDADGRCLVKVAFRAGSALPPWRRKWTYSHEGDLLEAEDSVSGASQYTYDAAHRLVNAHLPDGTEQVFTYDSAGNLLEQPGLKGVTLRDGNRLTSANEQHWEYNDRNDVARRLDSNGRTDYRYDSRDMLISYESEALTWEAKYDALAKRISKSYGAKRVEYYWDTDRLAAEINESGRLRIYAYADAYALVPFLLIEYDSPDSDPATGRRYFLFCNQIGAPVRVENDNGDMVWSTRLDPYGTAHIDPSSTIDIPLRFPGHYLDSETGLHYNRFRYYSPELGRYLQSDPLGFGGGINLYAYPSGPLSRVDVRGQSNGCPPSKAPPEEAEDMSDEELAAAIRDNPKDVDPDSLANRLRYERYRREGGTKSQAEWFGTSRGGRPGGLDHQADVARNNDPNNLDPNAQVGGRVPDGTGETGQVVDIRGERIDPGSDGRVITESERFGERGQMEAEGRRQLRDIRAADPNATIVATDPANPDAPPVVYPPGTQPPPVTPGQPVTSSTPTHVPAPGPSASGSDSGDPPS